MSINSGNIKTYLVKLQEEFRKNFDDETLSRWENLSEEEIRVKLNKLYDHFEIPILERKKLEKKYLGEDKIKASNFFQKKWLWIMLFLLISSVVTASVYYRQELGNYLTTKNSDEDEVLSTKPKIVSIFPKEVYTEGSTQVSEDYVGEGIETPKVSQISTVGNVHEEPRARYSEDDKVDNVVNLLVGENKRDVGQIMNSYSNGTIKYYNKTYRTKGDLANAYHKRYNKRVAYNLNEYVDHEWISNDLLSVRILYSYTEQDGHSNSKYTTVYYGFDSQGKINYINNSNNL